MERLLKEENIIGKRVFLRRLTLADISQTYVDWLNDSEVNHFLDIKHTRQTLATVSAYIQSYEQAKDRLLLGVFDIASNEHIGNITFSWIDWLHDTGVIGIAIGNKAYWGKGYGSEALSLSVEFAFNKLKLHRLEAGISSLKVPSQRLFEKVGFR